MTKLIVGNWKSHKSSQEIEPWVAQLKQTLTDAGKSANSYSDVQVILAPPYSLLQRVAAEIQRQKVGVTISLAVQDLSSFPAGAYTGAVSATNLTGLDVEYAIVGHSERRRYFHETHQEVANKVDQALAAQITPIVCVDEEYLSAQAAAISEELLERCVVAYEPLAAIGTGNNADVGQVKSVVDKVKIAFGDVPVIYGGSTNSKNINEYLLVCDGVLPGGSSLDPEEFGQMIIAAVVD